MDRPGRGSRRAELYDRLIRALPDEQFVFMNHGYVERGDDLTALAVPAVSRFAANLVRRMVRGVDLSDRRVLDVGCGRGGASAWLAAHGGCRQIIGLDLDPGNIAFCHRVHRAPVLAYVRGDAHELPLATASIDVTINVESSHCYPDLPQFFREVRRVLAPRGTFCYADALDRSGPGSALPARGALLEAAGFTVAEQVDITPQVADALFVGFEDQARFFMAAIERDPSQTEFLLRTLKGVTFAAFAGYATGRLQYGLWRATPR